GPDTAGIMERIKVICQALQKPDGSPLFSAENVIVGVFKDITNSLPACEITGVDDDTGRDVEGSGVIQGGQVDDDQSFLLELTFDNTDSRAVEAVTLPQARDALTKAFNTTAQLAYPGVRYAGLKSGTGRRGWSFRNGDWRRIYQIQMRVVYEYF